MSREFAEAVNKIEKLRSEALRAAASFRAFEVIQEKRAPNIIGQADAERNAKAMGDYKGLFNIAEHALNTEFLVSLAKLYDTHRDGTSIPKLINYIRSNLNNLQLKDFIEHNKTRPDIEERKLDYVGISNNDLVEIESTLDGLSPQIEKLKNLRDKRIAHLEVESVSLIQEEGPKVLKSSSSTVEDLNYGEIHSLIETAYEVLNKISSLLNRDLAEFGPYKETVTNDSEQLVELVRKQYDSNPS